MFEHLEPRLLLNSAPALATPLPAVVGLSGGDGYTLGIDASDPDGDPVTITASASDPSLGLDVVNRTDGAPMADLTFDSASGDRLGTVRVLLFDDRAEQAVERFVNLSEAGFNDQGQLDDSVPPYYNGAPVHELAPGALLATGDGTAGDGTGRTPLDGVDAEATPSLSFSSPGTVAMIPHDDGLNDNTFLMTRYATPWLNQEDYTIFGQVVSGLDVAEQIVNLPTDSDNAPVNPPVLDSVQIVENRDDAAVTIDPPQDWRGDASLTLSLDDGQGGEATYELNLAALGEQPELTQPEDRELAAGQEHVVPLQATDPEGLDLVYYATSSWDEVDHWIDQDADELHFVLPEKAGTVRFSVGVAELPYSESHGRPRVAQDFHVHSQTPETPSITSLIELLDPDSEDVNQRSLTVARDGDRLYVGSVDRLEVFDVSDEASPTRIGTFDLPRGGEVWEIELVGDTAFVAATRSGMLALDVSDPANIQPYQHDTDIRLAVDVEVAGEVAFVTDFYDGVIALDVSDLNNIQELDRVATGTGGQGEAWQLVRDRDRLLVSEATRGVVSVDISDPADLGDPQVLLDGSATALDLHDRTLFVVDQQGTLSSVDLSKSASPELLDSTTLSGAAGIVQYVYGKLLLSTLDGMSVVDASNPRNLEETFTYQLPDTGGRTALYGETLYVPSSVVLSMPAGPGLGVDLQQADLVVENVRVPDDSYEAGGSVAVQGDVRNIGNVAAGGSQIEMRLSQDRIFGNADDVVIFDGPVDGLDPQASRSFQATGEIPRSASPGPYFLVVRADSEQAVAEIDEGNNQFWSAGARVTIGATADLAPTADTFEMNEDGELRFTEQDLVDNDWSASGTVDLVSVDATDKTHGTITEPSGGEYIYRPEQDYYGLAEFEYVVTDGEGNRATGRATVEIAGVNDAPVAEDVQLYNPSGEDLVIDVPVTDPETPVDELTVEIVDGPDFGELTMRSDGTLLYDPDDGMYVDDAIQFRATDPEGASDTGTISVSMAHVIEGRGRLAVPGTNAVVIAGNVERALIYPDDTDDIGRIRLVGSNQRSALIVAGRAPITIGQILADGPVGLIKARSSTLVGDTDEPAAVDVAGPVRTMLLGDVRGEGQILLNTADEAGPRDTAALVFGDVTDVSLDTNGLPIRFLRAESWRDTAGSEANTIEAPHARVMLVLGPLEAGLNLTGADSRGYSVRKLVTLGAVSDVDMTMAGDAAVVVAGDWDGATLQADSVGRFISRGGLSGDLVLSGQDRWGRSLGLLYVADDVSGGDVDLSRPFGRLIAGSWSGGSVSAPSGRVMISRGVFGADVNLTGSGDVLRVLRTGRMRQASVTAQDGRMFAVIADRWDRSTLTADGLTRLVVQGDFDGTGDAQTELTLGAAGQEALTVGYVRGDVRNSHWDLTGRAGRLIVDGTAEDSRFYSEAGIGTVVTGASRRSDFLAGVELPEGTHRASDAAQFTNPAAGIDRLIVRGTRGPGSFFEDSAVAAGRLGSVQLRGIATGSEGDAFGLSARGGSGEPVGRIVLRGDDGVEILTSDDLTETYQDGAFVVEIV